MIDREPSSVDVPDVLGYLENSVSLETSIFLENSAALESTAPLEFWGMAISTDTLAYVSPLQNTETDLPQTQTTPDIRSAKVSQPIPAIDSRPPENLTNGKVVEIREQASISLLAERLAISHQPRKVGEIVVRKRIETRVIEVPVRHETLVIEQVGSNPRQLAVIDLKPDNIPSTSNSKKSGFHPSNLKGRFASAAAASQFLQTIAQQDSTGDIQVQVELMLPDQQSVERYQDYLQQYASSLC
jgi:Domain of unknown function (DUF2382)